MSIERRFYNGPVERVIETPQGATPRLAGRELDQDGRLTNLTPLAAELGERHRRAGAAKD